MAGTKRHPTKAEVKAREGTTHIQRYYGQSMNATCLTYRSAYDIDILFEDGTLKQHVRWYHFSHGEISPKPRAYFGKKPAGQKNISKRVGEIYRQNCGLDAECVRYNGSADIDVRFLKTGAVATHKTWYNFIKGHIRCPGTGHTTKN